MSGNTGSPRCILLCDDDRLVLATLSAGLRSTGFDVIEADNGDDAILLARQHRPQLALLDVRMAGKSGLDVAAYLRDYIGTPFVFLSAFSDEAIVLQATECGALDYLVKPVDVRKVVPAIEDALRRFEHSESRAAARIVGNSESPLDDDRSPHVEVLIATGILMERFRLTRAMAQTRLRQLATQTARDSDAAACDLVRQFDALHWSNARLPAPTA